MAKSKRELFLENLGKTRDLSYMLDENMSPSGDGEVDPKASETMIPMSALIEFEDHPFNVDDESVDFETLVDSIRENGLIYPILVRPVDDKYEIISGHRRVAACRKLEFNEISAIVRPLDDYEATVLMVQSNLYRSEIKPSEKAKAYRMCLDAATKYERGHDVASELGETSSESRRTVYRYIRLSYLIDVLLDRVDLKTLPVKVGEELSYLDADSQERLNGIMEENEISTLSQDQAKMLHDAFKDGGETLSIEAISAILISPKKNEKKSTTSISIKKKDLENYFGEDVDVTYATSVIHLLLIKYKEGLLNDFVTDEAIRAAAAAENEE